MSAFLGYIHHWLYSKINLVAEREQLIYKKTEEMCGPTAEELQAQVWQIYGTPFDAKLEDVIDHNNIHGWLQRQITIAETREAAFIKELMDACGDTARSIIKDAYEEHGSLCGQDAKKQGKYDAGTANGIYQAINDYLLNGMPCDQGDAITVDEGSRIIWESTVCLQERNWAKASVDKKFMKKLYQKWFTGFVTALNSEFTYSQIADTLQGDATNRHQIIKRG